MTVKNKEVKIVIKSRKELKSEFLVIEVGDVVQVKIMSPMTAGTINGDACLKVKCLDYSDNKNKTLIISAVIKNILLDSYGENDFIGKSFEIIRGEKIKGAKRSYNSYEVSEIEVE